MACCCPMLLIPLLLPLLLLWSWFFLLFRTEQIYKRFNLTLNMMVTHFVRVIVGKSGKKKSFSTAVLYYPNLWLGFYVSILIHSFLACLLLQITLGECEKALARSVWNRMYVSMHLVLQTRRFRHLFYGVWKTQPILIYMKMREWAEGKEKEDEWL